MQCLEQLQQKQPKRLPTNADILTDGGRIERELREGNRTRQTDANPVVFVIIVFVAWSATLRMSF